MARKNIGDFEDLKRRDSDGDGLSDYDEIFVYHSDPLNAHSNNDGISDYQKAQSDFNLNSDFFMKDFLIPNQNNNYRPHILKPKRILFYSMSAMLVKILVIAIVLVFPVTAWLTPDFLKTESQQIVVLTNNLRQSLDLSPLKENEVLQSAAMAKAEDMVVNQYFAHVSPDKKGLKYWMSKVAYNYQVAGENLAIGFAAPTEVVDAWIQSPNHYANLIDPEYTEIGVAMVAGQYQGFDTKLVAQMFGLPKIIPITVEQPPLEADKPIAVTNTDQSVLSEKSISTPVAEIIKPLAKPEIITNIQNLLTNESSIEVKISAPEAQEVSLSINGKNQPVIAVKDGQAVANLPLAVGANKIFVTAYLAKQSNTSPEYIVIYDNEAPIMDETKSFISAIRSKNEEAIIKVEALLSVDTKSAFVSYHGFNITLKNDSQNTKLWTANRIIEKPTDNFFDPIVPATLVATDLAGNITTQDLAWQKLILDNQDSINQYLFIKKTDSNYLKPIFNISAWYYKVMILLAFVALLLNIFIEIRKQHLKTIASTVGFMALLFLLILF